MLGKPPTNSYIPSSTTNTGFSRKGDGKDKCFPIGTQVNRYQETRINLATQEQGSAGRRKLSCLAVPLSQKTANPGCAVSKNAEPGLGLVLAARHKLRERDFGLTCHLSLVE